MVKEDQERAEIVVRKIIDMFNEDEVHPHVALLVLQNTISQIFGNCGDVFDHDLTAPLDIMNKMKSNVLSNLTELNWD